MRDAAAAACARSRRSPTARPRTRMAGVERGARRAGARLQFEHLPGLVERPDAREAAVEVLRPAPPRTAGASPAARCRASAPARRPPSATRRSRPAGACGLPARAPRSAPPCAASPRGCGGTTRRGTRPRRAPRPHARASATGSRRARRRPTAARRCRAAVIERDDDRRRDEHPPVAVEREERQRAEDVEVRFDAAAGQVDEQRAHQHLRDGDGVARRRAARAGTARAAPEDRQMTPPRKIAAQTCRCVRLTRPVPGQRRHPQREDDAGDPLERHQAGEQPVGALVDVALGYWRTSSSARRDSTVMIPLIVRRTADSRRRSCRGDRPGRG